MENIKIAMVLSVIAIILSIISISLVFMLNNNQNYQYLEFRIQQNFDLITNNEKQMSSDLVDITGDLQYYHNCINDAIKNFVSCVQFNNSNCITNFNSARNFCENDLKKQTWFE